MQNAVGGQIHGSNELSRDNEKSSLRETGSEPLIFNDEPGAGEGAGSTSAPFPRGAKIV
jgi:hypothetical protein